jgi:hypothetical protein
MFEDVDECQPKEIQGQIQICTQMKIIKKFKHGKKMFEGWKTYNMLIITNEVEAKGRGTKTLTT